MNIVKMIQCRRAIRQARAIVKPFADGDLTVTGHVGLDKADALHEAINVLTRAAKLDPGSHVAHAFLGYCHISLGDNQSAIREFGAALELDPQSEYSLVLLAAAQINEEKFFDAIVTCERVLAINPHSAPAHYNKGVAHLNLNNLDKASRLFEIAIEVNQSYTPAVSGLVGVLEQLKEWKRAREVLEKALIDSPENLKHLYQLGTVYLNEGNPELAARVLEDAYRRDPESVRIRLNLAFAYHDSGKHEASKKLVNSVIEVEPENVKALRLLGAIFYALGEIENSADLLSRAAAFAPDDQEIAYYLKCVTTELGSSSGTSHPQDSDVKLS